MIDGDTMELSDGERLRLLHVDTPETWRASCPAERAAGEAATATVIAWLDRAGSVVVVADGRRERWGRLLGDILIDGEPLSARLLAAGIAAPYDGRGPRRDWCDTAP